MPMYQTKCVRNEPDMKRKDCYDCMCGLASAKFKELTFQMVSRTHKHTTDFL